MKIGVWLNEDYNPQEGGGFSYYERLVEAIDSYSFDRDVEICYVTKSQADFSMLHHPVIRLKSSYTPSMSSRILCRLPLVGWHYASLNSVERNQTINRQYVTQLQKEHVGFIYYLTSGCEIPSFPFVATHWDIGHLSTYAFPELAMGGNFETRQRYFSNILPKALLTFVESEASRAELLRYTFVAAKKMRVVPIFAGKCVECTVGEGTQKDILDQFGLKKNQYFFYPAQFWAHKNHVGLLHAFQRFYQQHPEFRLVLTGSDKGNKEYIRSVVRDLKLDDAVVFPGFVPNETINCFYQNATALVMASFFGPTNMPPLEAMALGCPVIASDVEGHREQLKDAALYFEPMEEDSLSAAMEQMFAERDKYCTLITNHKHVTEFTLDVAIARINKYLKEAVLIRRSWKV